MYIEEFNLKAKAVEKENQKIQTHVQNEKETKDKELIKTLGEKLELAPEEQADLTAILVGE
jgi:pyruvate kinase